MITLLKMKVTKSFLNHLKDPYRTVDDKTFLY